MQCLVPSALGIRQVVNRDEDQDHDVPGLHLRVADLWDPVPGIRFFQGCQEQECKKLCKDFQSYLQTSLGQDLRVFRYLKSLSRIVENKNVYETMSQAEAKLCKRKTIGFIYFYEI